MPAEPALPPGKGIIWLASYPKSGNTWVRILLENLLSGSDTPVDINALDLFDGAGSRSWLDDVLGFDADHLRGDEIERLRREVYAWSGREEDSLLVKIHDALSTPARPQPLVEPTGTRAVIYVARNPLDVAPSLAAHLGRSIDHAIALMANEQASTAGSVTRLRPQIAQHWSSWSRHARSWLDATELPLHLVRYEDLKADTEAALTGIVAALGLTSDDDAIRRAVEHSRFEELARQERESGFTEKGRKAKRFFRAGKHGGWRDRLTAAQVDAIVGTHRAMMRRLGYLDESGLPL